MKSYVADLLTGDLILNLPHDSANWTQTLNDTESIEVTVPLFTGSDDASTQHIVNDSRILDLRNNTALGKSALIIEDDGKLVGGPIMQRSYDSDSKKLTLTASGMWTYFDHRVILPPEAQTKPLIDSEGKPDESLNSTWTKTTWNTIARNIVEQATKWDNGDVPIVFEEPETGTNQATYKAVDLKIVGETLSNITERKNGCDIEFNCKWKTDRSGFEWELKTGHPIIADATHLFNADALVPGLSGLDTSEDASNLATWCWFSAGQDDENVLVASAYNLYLTEQGAPVWDLVNTEHSTVSVLQTLQDYATEAAGIYYMPVSSTECKIHRRYLSSIAKTSLGSINVGDYIRFSTHNDWFFSDGTHTRRITALSGSESDNWISVTLGDVFGSVTVDDGGVVQ